MYTLDFDRIGTFFVFLNTFLEIRHVGFGIVNPKSVELFYRDRANNLKNQMV